MTNPLHPEARNRRADALVGLLLTAAVMLAWAPVASRYTVTADDFPMRSLFDGGLAGYHARAVGGNGAWRYLGFIPVTWGLHHPDVCGAVILAAHAVATYAFYAVCRELLGGRRLPAALALVFGVVPVAGGALVWTAASNLILLAAMFFWTQLLFLRWGTSPRAQLPLLVGSFALTAAAQFVQENLLFAFPLCGALLWIPSASETTSPDGRPATVRELMRARYSAFGPALGVVAFYAIYKWSQPVGMSKELKPWLRGLISPWFNQYRNTYVLDPWFHAETRGLAFWNLDPVTWVFAGLGVVGLAVALVLFARARRPAFAAPPAAAVAAPHAWSTLLYVALLAAGAGAIYALTYGFSYDSRKRYMLIPFVLLAAGWAVRRYARRSPSQRVVVACLLLVAAFGAGTTWIYVGVWRYTSHAYDRLATRLVADGVAGDVRATCAPDVYRIWPRAEEINFRMDGEPVFNEGIKVRGGRPVRIVTEGNVPTYVYRPAADDWERVAPER